LSNSCIKHIYYIVEDWQVAERMTYDGLQIMTAKSQIQVHNRFFLKETHKLAETIDFLATMTDVIIERHLRSDFVRGVTGSSGQDPPGRQVPHELPGVSGTERQERQQDAPREVCEDVALR
jgi:ERCC4-type nuclease